MPEGATDIYLVRHGESRAAIEGELFPLVNGQGDPELSSEGRTQALAVAEKLKQEGDRAAQQQQLGGF